MRADLALVEAGICDTRSQAQLLIKAGEVFYKGEKSPIKKASFDVTAPALLEIRRDTPTFVSRGGLKLWHAIEEVSLDVTGFNCIDFGQSTGGFTDCLLQRQARHVVGFDVGHEQLHSKLRGDPRVSAFEGVNLKNVDAGEWLPLSLEKANVHGSGAEFDLAVADLSFISLFRVFPNIQGFLGTNTRCLFLVKPQFEMGTGALDRRGIVRDGIDVLSEIKSQLLETCANFNMVLHNLFPCKIKGGDGNQEYFVFLSRQR